MKLLINPELDRLSASTFSRCCSCLPQRDPSGPNNDSQILGGAFGCAQIGLLTLNWI
jgi:hypothetical protein